jgi:branched-chain amino acid transport system ATP-binding protein
MSLLEVEGLEAGYGPVTVVRDLSFSVDEGKVVTILGANGAGKTTTLRGLSGVARARGRIDFAGSSLVGRSPERIVRRGIAHVPEGRGNFASLSVEENLRLGAYVRKDGAKVREDIRRCYEFFPRLEERSTQAAGSLSGGEQQMLAIARVLRMGARLLLCDEPTEGLSPVLVRQIGDILRDVKAAGVTVLLVEQNVRFASTVADRHYLLAQGRVVQTLDNAEVQEREHELLEYLGI